MSYASSLMEACPDMQVSLSNFYQTCDPSMLREPMPHWEWLWSETNTNGMQQMIVPGNAKVRTVVVTYEQRLLESEATDISSCDLNCTASTKRGNLTTSFTIDPCDAVEASELIATDDFIYICENTPDVVARKIQRLIDVVIRKLATRLVTRSTALLGGWASDTQGTVTNDLLQLTTRLAGTTTLNPETWEEVKFALMQSSFCDRPTAIIDGGTFYRYAKLMESGCCASSGLDLGSVAQRYGNIAVAYDKRVNHAIGANQGWVIQAGSLIPLYFTLNNNGIGEAAAAKLGFSSFGANYVKGVIADPATGFPLDIILSDNCGNLSIIVRGNADVKSLPTDLFAPGDEYEGVTGFAGLEVANT